MALLHAGVADSRQWDAQWDAFSARHRVLRYDARGFGRSTLPAGEFSRADDLELLLDAAGIQRTALVGASLGSRVALEVALRAPDRVSALVIVPPGLHTPLGEALERYGDEEEQAFERGDLDRAVALNVDLWVVGHARARSAVDPAIAEAVGAMQRRALELERAAVELGAEPGPERREPRLEERLGEITAPALVVVGDSDVPEVLESARLLERRLRSARLVVLEGVAHMVNMERPARVTSLVLDFLAETHEEA